MKSVLNKLKKIRRNKIKAMLIICAFVVLWGIVFPFSPPRNFARFLILITTANISNAAYFSAKELGKSGSVYFLKKAISWGDMPRAIAVGVGAEDYIRFHGENPSIDKAIFSAFFETKLDELNRDVLI